MDVRTQTELNDALKRGDSCIDIRGDGTFEVSNTDNSTVTAYGNSTVRAYDNSTVRATDNSTVTAYGNSTVRAYDNSTVTAYGNSTVRATDNSTVTAYDNSTVRAYDNSTVTAYDNSTVRATGNSTVRATDNSTVRATECVAIHKMSAKVNTEGGVVIEKAQLSDIESWCENYGIPIVKGVVTLFKAVRDDYHTCMYRGNYTPGTKLVAKDWDGGKAECGGGLHFSPTPFHALEFDDAATRFIACPLLAKEIVLHPNGSMPQKVKAPRVYRKCYEVDIDGKPLPVAPKAQAVTS